MAEAFVRIFKRDHVRANSALDAGAVIDASSKVVLS